MCYDATARPREIASGRVQAGNVLGTLCNPRKSNVALNSDAIEPGRYRHYKGNEYAVTGMARHSETHDLMVVCRPLYGAGGMWVRPAAMFAEDIVVDGATQPRFARL